MPSFATWQSRPVFITSTFRDMQAERDWLHTHVFPALAEWLRERYHYLEPIDLRWGVELSGASDQQSKELLVLTVCMDEIKRSRPFLIGLIGDRYGWTPPFERLQDAALESGYQGSLEGRSVTALEIEYGVLEDPGQQRRSRFYLRDPLPYEKMGAAASEYCDLYSAEPGAEEAHQRLEALKARLGRELPGRVRTYRAGWEEKSGVVTGLEDWGQMVLNDLRADLEEETGAFAHAAPATWQQEEAWVLEQFAATQCPDFIGREESMGRAVEFATAPGDTLQALAVTGEAGSGKSSWFGRLWELLLKREDCFVLAHAAGISARAGSVDAMLRRWIGELAGRMGEADPEKNLPGREAVEKTFAELLSRASQRERVVCLIDALNQFEPTPVARRLAWLPELWPANARLIATAIPGEESAALVSRKGTEQLELPVLDERESAAIVEAVCKRYHKTLPAPALQELLHKRPWFGQKSAGNPLWLQLALEELLLLDAADFARAEHDFRGTGEEKLAAMLASVARAFPPDVPKLYATVLERAERAYGAAWTRGFTELLALSRTGWRERDLEKVLPAVTGEKWDALRFATLRRGFRSHLVQRGSSAQWDFSHAQMRAAVERRYLRWAGRRKKLHALLAGHLAGLAAGDALRDSERMHHLMGAGERQAAARYYGDAELSPAETAAATRTLADGISAGSKAELRWIASMAGALKDPSGTVLLANRFLIDLQRVLADQTNVAAQLLIAEAANRSLEKLRRDEPDNADYARALGTCCEKLGELMHLRLDKLQQAMEFYGKSLQLREELRRREPDYADYARELAAIYQRSGSLYVELRDLQRAMEFHRKAWTLREELWQREPDNIGDARALSASCNQVADMHLALGEWQQALEFFGRSSSLCEELWRREPDNADNTRALSAAYNSLGYFHHKRDESRQGRREDAGLALEFYGKALPLREELRRRLPDSAEDACYLADTLESIADLNPESAGQWEEYYQKALALREELSRRAPDNVGYARRLSKSYTSFGGKCHHWGGWNSSDQSNMALEHYEKALTLRKDLWRHVTSADHAAMLQSIYDRLGYLHLEKRLGRSRRPQGPIYFKKSVSVWKKMRRREPGNTAYAANEAAALETLGFVQIKVCVRRDELRRATGSLKKAASLRKKLLRLEPQKTIHLESMAHSYSYLEDIYRELGQKRLARRYEQKCTAVRDELGWRTE